MIRSVTVVTPTYNSLSWLKGCVESVRAQTFSSVQHIVVDGGSSDGTPEWLRLQSDVEWLSEPDQGQSDAIAKGFRLAEGDLLCWLNADDRLLPLSCDRAVSLANKRRAEVILGACRFVDEHTTSLYVVYAPQSLCLRELADDVPVNQPSTFFTASIYRDVGGIDITKQLAMDHDLWMRFVSARAPTSTTHDVLSTFTVRDTSKTGMSPNTAFLSEAQASMVKVGPEGLALYMAGRLVATDEMEAGGRPADLILPLSTRLKGRSFELRGAAAELVRRTGFRTWPSLIAEFGRGPIQMWIGGGRMIAYKTAFLTRQRLLGRRHRELTI